MAVIGSGETKTAKAKVFFYSYLHFVYFVGTVLGRSENAGRVVVRWNNGTEGSYRFGADGCYDLLIVGTCCMLESRNIQQKVTHQLCHYP